MKNVFIFTFLLLAVLPSCNNEDRKVTPASENDLDAARNFIRAALDGKWENAKQFLVQDSVNVQLLETTESSYQTKSNEDKRAYHESSITLYDSRKIGDSITIVNYSNSYMNKKDSLKVVRSNGQWLIDLKYSLLARDSVKNAY
jgi:hypothetical protein